MANKKILEKKQSVIDEIKDKVNDSSSFVLFDYRGLTDAEIKELRCALRNADANYKVYKNTLMARAFNDLDIDLSSSLEGPSAFAYSKDQIAPIKVLSDFAKDHEALVVVNNDNLSLAIGKKGMNVRLAARLTHYKLDVKTFEQAREAGINIVE